MLSAYNLKRLTFENNKSWKNELMFSFIKGMIGNENFKFDSYN